MAQAAHRKHRITIPGSVQKSMWLWSLGRWFSDEHSTATLTITLDFLRFNDSKEKKPTENLWARTKKQTSVGDSVVNICNRPSDQGWRRPSTDICRA